MVFSSPIFLFWFLPLVLGAYYLTNRGYRNYVLLFFSLLFYAWAEGKLVTIMLASIAIDYFIGYSIGQTKGWQKKILLLIGVTTNLGLIVFYKYTNFFFLNYNNIAPSLHLNPVTWNKVIMPLGISFFVFHGISYIVDVYRSKTEPQKNIFDLALYITLFPQLIAGPIIRYYDINRQIETRKESLALFESGVKRFIIGFAKKVLIANNVGSVADYIFSMQTNDLTFTLSWIGAISYAIQVYFDFSGYSDMAIGLGRMFGFKFLENFNYPYISKSITEFWTRWHISLSNWFKDYVFIPLGGSRKGVVRNYINIIIIFGLMGFWHGAEWTCLSFGLLFALVICLEKLFILKLIKKLPRIIQNFYTIFIYLFIVVSIRSTSMHQLFMFWKNQAGLGNWSNSKYPLSLVMENEKIMWLIVGILFSIPILMYIKKIKGIKQMIRFESARFTTNILLLFIFFLSISYLAVSTYNPFIYFRF